jgi:putative oxidoreductase
MIRNRYLLFFFRLVVGGVFIWAGVVKILDPLDFAQSIANYRAFPRFIVFFLALILPWIEVFCGLFVISGLFKRSGALVLSVMTGCFLILITVTIFRGIDIDCGCFGPLSSRVNYKLILEDLLLLFFSINIFLSRSPLSND